MPDNDSIGSKFQGLPIAELIAAPLKATCDSQKLLAHSTYEFVTQIGFTGEKNDVPRMVSFELERSILGQSDTSKVKVRAPFLGLVPIPALLIDDVQINFQMEVTDNVVDKSNSSSEGSLTADATFKFGPFCSGKVNIAGKVSSSRENTRTTNQTAKYQIHVSARQQQPPEGLSKLMDIMAASIEPVPSDDKK